MKRTMKLLAGSILLVMAPLAAAQTTADVDTQTTLMNTTAANRGQTQVATRIASDFTTLAGSTDNSLSLVNALRNGTAVTLTETTTTTSFTPPTGKMGWGNVFISLALAQQSLAQLGVTQPTAAQLQAALMGGDVTVNGKTTTLQGVLTMRASGMGWGQIAQSLGTKLGPVVSSIKSARASVATLPAGAGTTAASTTTTPKTASAKSGMTTADGATQSSQGNGAASSHGLVTASGATASAGPSSTHGQGNALGRGLVTAAGGSAGGVVNAGAANGNGHGAGLVTASGGSASTTVTTAQGNGASGQDHGKGHGKGGG